MKNIRDIDTLLSTQAAPKPKRELRPDFTAQIMATLKENPQPRRRAWWQRYLQFHKQAAAFASIAVLLVVTATAYATTDGFTQLPSFLNIRHAEQQTLKTGERIITIDTQGCKLVEWDETAKKLIASDRTYLYRVKSGSSITNDQVAQMVQGKCEFEAQTNNNTRQSALATYTTSHPEDKDHLVGGYANEIITAITPTSLSTHGEMQFNGALKSYDLTFKHIASDATVTENGELRNWNDLQVGDSIAYVYLATGNALKNSETTPPWVLNTDETTMMYVEKNSPNVRAYFDYMNHYGLDFEQVLPCEKGPGGYCSKYGPTPPPLTELDNSPASMTIQNAYMILANSYGSYLKETHPEEIVSLQKKFLDSFAPALRAKIEASPNYSAALCGHTMTEFFTEQNAKQTGDTLTRDILFTAHDGSQFTIAFTASTKTNLITDLRCQ